MIRPTSRTCARFLLSLSLAASLAATLAACDTAHPASPEDAERARMYKHGSVLGGEGGLSLFGSSRKQEANPAGGLAVNGFLWRATLDTLSFMPLASADPFGGVVLTDWYSPADAPGERFKVNVYILNRQLRADAVKVSIFRQRRDGGGWSDAPVAASTVTSLEDGILTRARQLRLNQKGG